MYNPTFWKNMDADILKMKKLKVKLPMTFDVLELEARAWGQRYAGSQR